MDKTSQTDVSPLSSTPVTTYVHDGVEVLLTGRQATKTVRPGVSDTVVEIRPADPLLPSSKKWVRRTDLYEISK